MLEGMDDPIGPAVTRVPVVRVEGDAAFQALDALAVEEPLELRLAWGEGAGHREEPVSITMRTPGADLELALGFLVGEGIVKMPADVVRVAHVGPPARPDGTTSSVRVHLARDASKEIDRLARHFYATSSCGVCGKASVELLRLSAPPLPEPRRGVIQASVLHAVPKTLRDHQGAFNQTGGLHAAALFTESGELRMAREDVGRHNAVDKVVGAAFQEGALPLSQSMLVVSGRASFELAQKALMAGIPTLLAVGAPSSLAVELAREAGMTLVGFLRDGRFNVYAGRERIRTS
jgi:FdhD protein